MAALPLPNEGQHANRLAIEEQSDGSVHIHYRDLRIHQKPADFLNFARQMWAAYLAYSRHHVRDVSLADLKTHDVVRTYLRWLDEYEDKGALAWADPLRSASSVADLYLISRYQMSMSPSLGLRRPEGLPQYVPQIVSNDFDRSYLIALYESILEYGFGEGPYAHQYMLVYRLKDGSLYAKDSHRYACLKFLGREIVPAVVVDAESGWDE